jgi:hypothetical protein
VTIDSMSCEIANQIVAHKADYLLALKGNQPTLEAEIADYFSTASSEELVGTTTVEKGLIETRTCTASSNVEWIVPDRSYPGETRSQTSRRWLRSIRVPNTPIDAPSTRGSSSRRPSRYRRLANGARGHWGCGEYALVTRREIQGQSVPLPSGHGAKNMAIVRRFALGLIRAHKVNGSIKTRRSGTHASSWRYSSSNDR